MIPCESLICFLHNTHIVQYKRHLFILEVILKHNKNFFKINCSESDNNPFHVETVGLYIRSHNDLEWPIMSFNHRIVSTFLWEDWSVLNSYLSTAKVISNKNLDLHSTFRLGRKQKCRKGYSDTRIDILILLEMLQP